MKRSHLFWCLLLTLATFTFTHGALFKGMKVGAYWDYIADNCQHGQPEGKFGHFYFNNFAGWGEARGECIFETAGLHYACTNWTEPGGHHDYDDLAGTTYPYWIGGGGHAEINEYDNVMAIPDANGQTIHQYWRYAPPSIIVDGMQLTPALQAGEEVNPTYIDNNGGGNADMMIESWANTMVGITIHQKVFGWSAQNHDDYHIYDWTLTNTGQLDLDADIETTQDITGFYMSHENHYGHTFQSTAWWTSAYGELARDTIGLRMTYFYPANMGEYHVMVSGGTDEVDLMGQINNLTSTTRGWGPSAVTVPLWVTGFPERPFAGGDCYLFVSDTTDPTIDAPYEPIMTDVHDQDLTLNKPDAREITDNVWRKELYETIAEGFLWYDGSPRYPDEELAYPGTYHGIRTDEKCMYGYEIYHPWETPWFTARAVSWSSIGPYDIPYGDSIRVVWARGLGTISAEKAWEVGTAWLDSTSEDNAVSLWDYDAEGGWKLPPAHDYKPDLLNPGGDNDRAKDSWIMTSVDTLFRNMWNAQWNFDNGYTVPSPPWSPSIEVTSGIGAILVEWGNEPESAPDFAGYRVYHAKGNPGPTVVQTEFYGSWELCFEVEGTDVHAWYDTTAERAQDYYYIVTAFDDGLSNGQDVTDQYGNPIYPANQPLESGMFLNRTTMPASAPGAPHTDMSDIRVVPNPFNIQAAELQYIGAPDKIMFLDVPAVCTIRIFTESGDLVQTIEHTDGTGDESWGVLTDEHQASMSGQRVVSGVYIAHFETPEGDNHYVKFAIVR